MLMGGASEEPFGSALNSICHTAFHCTICIIHYSSSSSIVFDMAANHALTNEKNYIITNYTNTYKKAGS